MSYGIYQNNIFNCQYFQCLNFKIITFSRCSTKPLPKTTMSQICHRGRDTRHSVHIQATVLSIMGTLFRFSSHNFSSLLSEWISITADLSAFVRWFTHDNVQNSLWSAAAAAGVIVFDDSSRHWIFYLMIIITITSVLTTNRVRAVLRKTSTSRIYNKCTRATTYTRTQYFAYVLP